MLAASYRLTCSRFYRALSFVVTSTAPTMAARIVAARTVAARTVANDLAAVGLVAIGSVVAGSGCGSAKHDGLFDAHAGAGGAAGNVGAASAGGAAGSDRGGAGGSAGSSAGAAGSDSGSGGAAGGSGGSAGSAGSGNVLDRDAGADAALGDASSANRLGCAPADQADCDVLASALAHRYSFTGSNASVLDSVGVAHGSVVNGQVSGSGGVVLTGAASPENYVDLPNGIVSALPSATFEAWVNWAGGEPWQRIFDFGSSQTGEDVRGGGLEYMFLTPRSDVDTVRVTFLSSETLGEVQVNSTAPLPSGVISHLAVVVDGQANTLALFVDGASAGSIALPSSLAALAGDNNNWLGRSEFPTDPGFAGSLLELRMYSAPLSAGQVALSFQLGPDVAVSQ